MKMSAWPIVQKFITDGKYFMLNSDPMVLAVLIEDEYIGQNT